jgi:hypothetical protein
MVVLCMGMAFLAGCAKTSVTRVGSETFAPLSDTADVRLFSNESELQSSYVTVGILTHANPGATGFDVVTFDDAALEALKNKARAVGANAIILDQVQPGGAWSGGLRVRARAIRIPEKARPSQ